MYVPACMWVTRFFNTDKDGWMSFPEFNAALVRLNFVGKQDEVAALFERYGGLVHLV